MNVSDLPLGKGRCRHVVEMAHARRQTQHRDLVVALDDPDYVEMMFRLGGASAKAHNLVCARKALVKLLAEGSIDWARDTLAVARRKIVRVAKDPRLEDTRDNVQLKTLPDMVLYAQSQGLVSRHGWSARDLFAALDFKLALRREGLDDHAAQRDFRFVVHFIIWARLHAVARAAPTDDRIEAFAEHDCVCGLQVQATTPTGLISRRRALRRWRRFLNGDPILTQNGDVRRENRKPPAPLAPSVAAFKAYLLDERGFVPATVASYINDIARWHHRLGEDAGQYTPRSIRRLCREEFAKRAPGAQTRFLSVLRGYIAFRAGNDECDRTLLNAIVSRPTYTQGTIPKTKPFKTLRGYIAACDTDKPVGLRARAVMALLLETGIRAKEAGHLKLEDIDWENGEFVIDGKGRQREAMPLPESAGHAMLDWLEKGRPQCDCPYVFVRLRRPYQALNLNSGISTLVQAELRKQGVRRSGAAHVFRHSFARQHLKGGLTLPQIGRLLRHRIVDTTQIYTKVDDRMLAALAQDWPGEAA